MKRIVSFFGDQTDVFEKLNQKAESYASSFGILYRWAPQHPFSQEEVIHELQNADAGIIDVEHYGEEIFSQIKETAKILVRFGVGYDQVDLDAASKNGIAIARTTGANTNGVAEMALTLMLDCRRRIPCYMECTKTGNWVKEVGNELIGSTVGIIGYGAIGKRLAKLLKGFDCNIIAYDPFPNVEAMKADGITLVKLDDIFAQADAISIHVPYTKETHHMVNKERLSMMKPNSVIVNTSRGNIVDEDALYEILKEGKIRAAGLDVFAQEPLPLDSPLLSLDNIILTPHVSSQTEESLWNIYKMAIDICSDFFNGKVSKNILNPDYK